jgi:hypothetical protein
MICALLLILVVVGFELSVVTVSVSVSYSLPSVYRQTINLNTIAIIIRGTTISKIIAYIGNYVSSVSEI